MADRRNDKQRRRWRERKLAAQDRAGVSSDSMAETFRKAKIGLENGTLKLEPDGEGVVLEYFDGNVIHMLMEDGTEFTRNRG